MSTDGPSGQPDEEPDRQREDLLPGKSADHRAAKQTEPEMRARQEYYDILSSGGGQEIVGFAALMAERPASERHEWQIPLSRGEVDRCGLGVIDERSKRFSAAERRIAEHLAAPGPAVVSVPEGYGIYGRTAGARATGRSRRLSTAPRDTPVTPLSTPANRPRFQPAPAMGHFAPNGEPVI